MEEIQRQTFVPPKEKGPGLAQRAGAALNNLRQKIVGEEPVEEAFPDYHEPAPAPRPEAPVYSAETFQSEAAPELGWENPFTNPTPKKKEPVRTVERRTRPASRSYPEYGSYPVNPAYPEASYGYPAQDPSYAQAPYYPDPQGNPQVYYPSGYAAPAAGYPQDDQGQAYYPPEDYGTYSSPMNAYPQGGYAPQMGYDPVGYGQSPPGDVPHGYDPAGQGYQAEWNGARNQTPVRRSAPRKKTEIGDFKYMFWSGTIVVGILLTLTAFIYGCSI